MYILITESSDYSPKAVGLYEKLATVILLGTQGDFLSINDVPAHILTNTIGLVVRLNIYLGSALLNKFPSLRFIVSPTTGITHIDGQVLLDRSITLFTLSHCSSEISLITSTSEHAFGLLLSLIRRIPLASSSVSELHEWNRDAFVGRQLSSMSIGLIGFGRLGRQMYKLCQAFSMNVNVYDPYVHNTSADISGINFVSLQTLLSCSDVISLHASYRIGDPPILTNETLKHAKRGSYIINTARGELIDPQPVVDLLSSGYLSGLAVDVLDHESIYAKDLTSHPFVQAYSSGLNVIITPHLGGCTSDAMRYTELILSQYVCSVIK